MRNTNQNSVSNENNTVHSSRGERCWKWVKVHIFGIFYVILLIGLWVYIIINWNKCISMKFFDQFDGNNILFLVGIVLVIAFFYDVESKDFKFHRRKNENMGRQFQNIENAYNNSQAITLPVHVTTNESEEENSDEQTRSSNGN